MLAQPRFGVKPFQPMLIDLLSIGTIRISLSKNMNQILSFKIYIFNSHLQDVSYFVQVQYVISLRQSDVYMHQWFKQWFVAWTAPSHYLNQCWNIVNWTLRNKPQWNLNGNSYLFFQENAFENVIWKMASMTLVHWALYHQWTYCSLVTPYDDVDLSKLAQVLPERMLTSH